ncbi:MAG TPA: glycoside hydrolase family 9 protein [Cyclobacteriaceae bacterium]
MKHILSVIFLSISIAAASGQQLTTTIRLNQIGFLPNAKKLAVINSSTAKSFEIRTPDLSKVVFTGLLGSQAKWTSSNEYVKIADFSSFSSYGEFVIVVPELGYSTPFKITATVFEELSKGSIKAFYFNRASTALLAENAGIYARAAGHPDNAVVVLPSAASTNRPAGTILSTPYGWYDAGDYNKYVVNSGISTFTLLSAYESSSAYYDTLTWNIPESSNGIPDILDEALWNIKWLMTMQDPDDGGVYNKTTNANFDGFVMPDKATSTRYIVAKGTAATLDFAAIMAMTARIYKNYAPSIAADALAKATLAWQWANSNPNIAFNNPAASGNYPAITTGGYGDGNFNDEFAWAAAELYVTTLDETYYKTLNLASTTYDIPGWPNVQTLGLLSIVTNRKNLTSAADTTLAKSKLTSIIQSAKSWQQTSPYRIPTNNFFWGSNSDVANTGMILMQVYKLTNDVAYFNAGLAALDYLMGRNATTYSFVTGYGSKTPKNIHHRPSGSDGIVEPIPGFIAGGPNPQNTADDCGTSAYPSTLPALCYLDMQCSYSTNEIAINWNAPLAFLSGAVQYEYIKTFSPLPQKYLSVSNRNVILSRGGSGVQTSVLSNGEWSLSSNQLWCVPSLISGLGDKVISISSLTENNEGAPRTATIKIKGAGTLVDSIVVIQDIVTAVEKDDRELSVFPNPATNTLVVDLNTSDIDNISLLSINGIPLGIKPNCDLKQCQFNVSSLSKGLYFVRVAKGDHVFYRKFLIMRD